MLVAEVTKLLKLVLVMLANNAVRERERDHFRVLKESKLIFTQQQIIG